MTTPRLLALFALGALLFGWPALAVVERFALALDAPVLYLYLLGAWAVLVIVTARLARRRR